MNVLADIIIALIGVAVIALYAYKGFIRVILDTFKILIAFLIARLIVPSIAIANPVVGLLVYIVVFVAVFVLLSLVFSLADKIIKKIPIVRTLNRVLGLVLGVGFVYLSFSIAAVIFKSVAAYSPESVIGAVEATLAAQSKIYSFFAENGLFSLFT